MTKDSTKEVNVLFEITQMSEKKQRINVHKTVVIALKITLLLYKVQKWTA